MQHEDRWLVPRLSDRPFLEHPPLAYALIGASIGAFGATETAARLPGALASFATAWMAFALGRRLAGPRAGLAALLVLVGMNAFFRYSHRVLVDPVLAACVMLGCFCYVGAAWPDARSGGARDARVPRLAALGIYVAAALAFLTKGPVGLALLGGPIAWDVIAWRGRGFLRSWGHALGAPLLLALCGAWLAWLRHAEGEAALQAFLVQNGLLRVVPSMGGGSYTGGHARDLWYYLPRIPALLGWTVALLPALVAWMRRGGAGSDGHGAALRFLALAFPVGFALLSLVGTKRSLYLLPLCAPLAVPLGAWIASLAHEDPSRSRVEIATARLCALATVAFSRRELRAPGTGPRRAPLRVAALVYAGSVAWNVLAYPHFDRDRDLGPLAREIVAQSGPGPVVGFRLDEAMRGAIPFYTGRSVRDLDSEEAARQLAESERPILVTSMAPLPGVGESLRAVWSATADDVTYSLLRASRSGAS